MDADRDIELILLGAVLASTALATAAFRDVSESDLTASDLRPVYEELRKDKKLGPATTAWMKRRGVTVDGKAINSVIAAVAAQAKRRKLAAVATRLQMALAGGCAEEAEAAMDELQSLREKKDEAAGASLKAIA